MEERLHNNIRIYKCNSNNSNSFLFDDFTISDETIVEYFFSEEFIKKIINFYLDSFEKINELNLKQDHLNKFLLNMISNTRKDHDVFAKGKIGEMLMHIIAYEVFGLDYTVPKYKFETNKNQPTFNADGVFSCKEKIVFAESKFHKEFIGAFDDITKDLKKYENYSQISDSLEPIFEFRMTVNRNALLLESLDKLEYLDSELFSQKFSIGFLGFIGYCDTNYNEENIKEKIKEITFNNPAWIKEISIVVLPYKSIENIIQLISERANE